MVQRAKFLQVAGAEPEGRRFSQVCPSITVNQDLAALCKASVADAESLAMTNQVKPDERPCHILRNCAAKNHGINLSEVGPDSMEFKVCTGEVTGFEDAATGMSRPYTEDERKLACNAMNENFRVMMAEIEKGKGTDIVRSPSKSDNTTTYLVIGGVALLALGAFAMTRR